MVSTGTRRVVGVRFHKAGRVSYFDPAGLDLRVNDQVVARTERGLELGQVVIAPSQVIHSEVKEGLSPLLRKAMPEDLSQKEALQKKDG